MFLLCRQECFIINSVLNEAELFYKFHDIIDIIDDEGDAVMKKRIRYSALIVVLALLLCVSGCGKDKPESKYTVVESLYTEEFSIAFRQGDRLCDVVSAALKVLAAEGKVAEISSRWFGEDITTLEGDALALDSLDYEYTPRTFIMGLDQYSPPMSFLSPEAGYTGFDVELAMAVCEKLGWEIEFQSIDPVDAKIELNSGNVDAVWGGMSFSAVDSFSLSPAYMSNEKVLISKSGSDIRKMKDTSGKILGVRSEAELAEIKTAVEGVTEKLGSIRVFLGADKLFTALDNGLCDLVIADSLAIENYY